LNNAFDRPAQRSRGAAAELCRQSPIDPKESAFYYLRAIEIPKPRWTAYDARYFDTEIDDDIPMTTQDRAYTSPIWYTPPATHQAVL
jgi:hypothetical protein